ncbi:MAG: hypothetical protein ACRDRO_20075 [Pseudonocardiaceae bacterium]
MLFDDDPRARVHWIAISDDLVDDGVVLVRLVNLSDLDDFVAVVAAWVLPEGT